MISVTCPHCHATQKFDGSAAGRVVNCQDCRLPMQLPIPQAVVAPIRTKTEPPRQLDTFEFNDETEAILPHRRQRYRGNQGSGTAALVLGIISVIVPFLQILGPVAIMVANGTLRNKPGDGCATAGLVLGWIASALLFLSCLYLMFIFGLIGALR